MHEVATESPVRKRIKKVANEFSAPPLVAAKISKAGRSEKTKAAASRYSTATATNGAAPAHETTAKATKPRKKDEKVHAKRVDVLSQDRQVFKAIASHAAATAAVKRYNLRSDHGK